MKTTNFNMGITHLMMAILVLVFIFAIIGSFIMESAKTPSDCLCLLVLISPLGCLFYFQLRNLFFLPIAIKFTDEISVRTWFGTKIYRWDALKSVTTYQLKTKTGIIPIAKHLMLRVGFEDTPGMNTYETKVNERQVQQLVTLIRQKSMTLCMSNIH